ncbi:right-handed parallel beta-helix repeat-containing protein, partial [candidate division KSB1 bacterium]|nr:right-handed parallel beta-helix repeat-containing protein [candidate division KSB1 bacterium]
MFGQTRCQGHIPPNAGTDTSASGNTAYIQNLARNTTSFSLVYGEFAHLGWSQNGQFGITFDGLNVRGEISSSTVRNGYRGIDLDGADSNSFTSNLVYRHANKGVHLLSGPDGNTFTSNHVYANSSHGMHP